MKIKRQKSVIIGFATLMCAVQIVFADASGDLRLDKGIMVPLETLNIQVLGVTASCTINVVTPAGHTHSFTGTIAGGTCTATYVPSYLTGSYQISAVRDGNSITETDTFIVRNIDAGKEIRLTNWQINPLEYMPGDALTLTAAITDANGVALTGFSKTIGDTVVNQERGALSIQRKIVGIDSNGRLICRLYMYFDATGSPNILGQTYAEIYSGTRIDISLFGGDGNSVLNAAISMTPGYENNDDGALSATLISNVWSVSVTKTIVRQDKIAYLDVAIPQTCSLADVIFSVDFIQYNHNPANGDYIYISGSSVSESQFPTGYIFTTGYLFSNLGRFPIRLPLNPKPTGVIYFHLNYQGYPGHDLNDGTITETTGTYANSWIWKRAVNTSAQVTFYADRWGYRHAYGSPVTITLESPSRDNVHILNYVLDKRVYTEGETRQFTANLKDEYANPVNGYGIRESVANSENGRLSIVSQHLMTDPNACSVVRLLLYFDTTGRWSDIYAGTSVSISIFGPDGLSGVDPAIVIREGSINAGGCFSTALTNDAGVYSWNVNVATGFTGQDRQAYLDFYIPENHSASEVVYAINRIVYKPNMSWADEMVIKTTSRTMSQFPMGESYGTYEFNDGDYFGALGYFPLYLSLNPTDRSIFVKMCSNVATLLNGVLSSSSGNYTYSHTWSGTAGPDYNTAMCISRYGHFDNKNRCTPDIMLYFSGEPRYLGGLEDAPIMLGTIWQKNLNDHFFISLDYNDVEYRSSDVNVAINGSIVTFSPNDTNDTIHNLVLTASKISDPCVSVSSNPFTLYAANCMKASDCTDANKARQCVQYQCEYYDPINMYQAQPQGCDLSVFNQDVNMSPRFPLPGQPVQIYADVYNKGTTYAYDVQVNFYLDDTNSTPIDTNTIHVVPITYFDLPFRSERATIQWTVPSELRGSHKIWVKVDGMCPGPLTESMLSNNYATLDFFVSDPNITQMEPGIIGSCDMGGSFSFASTSAKSSILKTTSMLSSAPSTCSTVYLRIPITVQVCENETLCAPVTGYEHSYWGTWYWPSWSGYCQEFNVAGEAMWALILTYEVAYGIFSAGGPAQPSLLDGYNLLQVPYGWSEGWLPCHPAPTLFPYLNYGGVDNPGCGGLCPVSAWDCGEGVHFTPRFDSPYYNAYEYSIVSGGVRKITRCYPKADYIEMPYQMCYPDDGNYPEFNLPFKPFDGGPGQNTGSYGPGGMGTPGSGPGGTSPIRFEIGPPMGSDSNNASSNASFECYFCSTGDNYTNAAQDTIHCSARPPYTEVALQKGWNLWTATLDPVDANLDCMILLRQGWNMFGYSSPTAFKWLNAKVIKGTQTKSITDAGTVGWLQSTVYYYDPITKLTKFVPDDDQYLKTNRGYWLYAAEPNLTLSLPDSGGSLAGTNIPWQNIVVRHGDQTKSLRDAEGAGWLNAAIYYYDLCDANYASIPSDSTSIQPWNGYLIYSLMDDVTLITGDSGQARVLERERQGKFMYAIEEQKRRSSRQSQWWADAKKVTGDGDTIMTGNMLTVGNRAPDFALSDSTGRLVDIRQYRGKDILLVFGTTSCLYCATKIPLLNKLGTEFSESGMKVLFVALGANQKTVQRFIQERDVKCDILIDPYGRASRQYGIRHVPEVFIIDKDGIIQYGGPQERDDIWQLLNG